LDALCAFGRVLTSRAPQHCVPHKEALQQCVALGAAWAARKGGAPAELKGITRASPSVSRALC
jgi:hypothetical protein